MCKFEMVEPNQRALHIVPAISVVIAKHRDLAHLDHSPFAAMDHTGRIDR
jgi:hypothetical protein